MLPGVGKGEQNQLFLLHLGLDLVEEQRDQRLAQRGVMLIAGDIKEGTLCIQQGGCRMESIVHKNPARAVQLEHRIDDGDTVIDFFEYRHDFMEFRRAELQHYFTLYVANTKLFKRADQVRKEYRRSALIAHDQCNALVGLELAVLHKYNAALLA